MRKPFIVAPEAGQNRNRACCLRALSSQSLSSRRGQALAGRFRGRLRRSDLASAPGGGRHGTSLSRLSGLIVVVGALTLLGGCARHHGRPGTPPKQRTKQRTKWPSSGPAWALKPEDRFRAGMAAYRAKRFFRARALLGSACDDKHAGACLQLGNLASRGVGQAKAPREALRHFIEACHLAALRGCYNAGVALYTGLGTKASPRRGVALFMRGCFLGHGPSCYNAGVALFTGHGVPRDRRRAKRMFFFGCKAGDKDACAQISATQAHHVQGP